MGGHPVSGRTVPIHQDSILRDDHDHGRDRSHHSQNSFARDGSHPALGTSVARGDRPFEDRSRHHQRYGHPDTGKQYALLFDSGRSAGFLCRNLCGLSFAGRDCNDDRDHWRCGDNLYYKNRRIAAEKQKSAEWEGRLFDRLTDFLDGFKEVRLNAARSLDLFEDASEVSRTAANIKINSQAETFKLIVTSQISMYVLIGAVVFVAPQFSEALGGLTLTKTTTALMFIVGACFGLVQSIPILLNANAAADRIEQLEIELQATASAFDAARVTAPSRFDAIEMTGIQFRYVDKFSEATFKIGPIDFNLHPGELVFITGGNGSGKSTFLRVLAGLYPPDSGQIRLNGQQINDETRDRYRSL